MLTPGPLTVDQVLANCAKIEPFHRRHRLETVIRDTGVDPIGCKHASSMVERTVNLHKTGIPPAGAVVLWTGGTDGDGHITVSAGGGDCWTVDWIHGLHQTKVAIWAINRTWNSLCYQGWATNYGGRYQLDVEGGQDNVTTLPSLKLSYFLDSMAEIPAPRNVRRHPVTVATAEHALKKLGFDPGSIDGHYGTATDDAVRAFQASLHDPKDGKLGPKQWAKLASRSGLFLALA